MSNRPVHFEIHADDPVRAAKFYTEVFGWTITKWDMSQMGGEMANADYWMVMTDSTSSPQAAGKEKEPGINGGLLKRPCPPPAGGTKAGTNAYILTMQVENYDAIHEKIMKAGGQVAIPKFAFPGMAWQGYYIDTEGNTFGLHQADKDAK